MIIFNTTYLISSEVHEAWLRWVSSQYIPAMLATSLFLHPRLFKVLVGEEEGITYSLQFAAANMEAIRVWRQNYQKDMESGLRKMFGESVLFFQTLLEEIK